MKYKVGDRVRIKSREWVDSLHSRELPSGCNFVPRMDKYLGQTAIIVDVREDSKRYSISIDNKDWSWTDEMFEEEHLDKRQKALDRIKKAEAEIAEAKKLLEEPDPRIGKLCNVWDNNEFPLTLLIVKDFDSKGRAIVGEGFTFQHARLLTQEEKEKYL